MIALLFVLLLALFALGVPVAVSLGLTTVIGAWALSVPLIVLPQKMFEGMDSLTLATIPLFFLAGELMIAGGIANRLTEMARAAVGYLTGALAQVSTLTGIFFAGMSGSGAADTAAVASVMIPMMKREGYPEAFSASTIAAAGILGQIIPPSITMVLYGVSAGVSIGALFLAGIVPGLLIGTSFMVLNYLFARRFGLRERLPMTLGERLKAIWAGLPTLGLPVVIVGGIYFGVFTATEAAAVAALYALVLGLAFRELTLGGLLLSLRRAAYSTGMVMFIVATANGFGWFLVQQSVPQDVAHAILGASGGDRLFTLILINLLLLITGMFLNPSAGVLIMTPILLPVLQQLGIPLVYFGVVMVVNLSIGLITPPVGVDLFVVSGIANVRVERLARAVVPYILVAALDLALFLIWPGLIPGGGA